MTYPAVTDGSQFKIPQKEAKRRLEMGKQSGAFLDPYGGDQINEDLCLQAVALKEDGSPLEIMHTDACRCLLFPFRGSFLSQTILTNTTDCLFQTSAFCCSRT